MYFLIINHLPGKDERILSHPLNPYNAEAISTDIHSSDDETPSPSVNELSHPAAEAVSKYVRRSGTTGPGVDEVYLPTVTEVSTALQPEDCDIIVDSKRKSETRSLQFDS